MKRLSAIALFASLLIGCSDSVTSSNDSNTIFVNKDENHAGMMLVTAKTSSTQMGSKLTVHFSYDFSIDKHEVTCGDYAKQIKTNCDNSELPITNVTFFDAVLFANKKSKAEKLDTAYSYTSATFDSEGHCTDLIG